MGRSSTPSGQIWTICSIVTGPLGRARTIKSSSLRAHDGLANSCAIASGVCDKTITLLIPHLCSVRNRRSRAELPHNLTNASGLSARTTHCSAIVPGRNQLSGMFEGLGRIDILPPGRSDIDRPHFAISGHQPDAIGQTAVSIPFRFLEIREDLG